MIIALASGKGGVGVTSLAIALGASLVEHGVDTTLVDASLTNPNVGLYLGTASISKGIHELLHDATMLNDAVYHHAPSGLKVIPGKISLTHAKAKQPELLKLHPLTPQLSTMVLLDCASGMHHETLAGIAIADELIAVTTPELPSVINTLKLVKRARELGTRVRGIVINQTGRHGHELAVGNIQALLETEVIAVIPHDANVSEAQAVKHPFTYSHPDSIASVAVRKLAIQLVG